MSESLRLYFYQGNLNVGTFHHRKKVRNEVSVIWSAISGTTPVGRSTKASDFAAESRLTIL